jgi:phosphate transport system permease protein
MAVPTIFTLAEDALRNVPRGFKEASYALGANRLQTIMRVLVPASLSGIVSAILLGLGRVIGETMVVLLCAGNRIAIPDFSEGLGAFFQPVHTMTGIIAQEMGEVVRGSLHYRALFMVGLVLFVLTLVINYFAQKFVTRYRMSIG